MKNMKYTAHIINENLAPENIKLGLDLFNEHLNREGIGLRVAHVDNNQVVYEPFIISHEAPISLKTIDGKVTTLKLRMYVYMLPSEERKAVLDEAMVMLRSRGPFIIGREYCTISVLQTIEFTPNTGEEYHRVTVNGTFMPHRYPFPKQWVLKIKKTIENTTVGYIMSLKQFLDSNNYELTSHDLFEDIKTPHKCFVTPKGHAECYLDMFDKESETLFSTVYLTGAEQEQIYEGIVNYLENSADDTPDKAFEVWEASMRHGL
jgi:hypothetical protein